MDFIRYLSENHNINLNEQQQKAVTTIDGPILLLAVPGGGKTTVITARCANMVMNHKISPSCILTLTFSKASATDMERRFQAIFGSEIESKLHFSTIHSFCYSVIRTYMNRMALPFPAIIEDETAKVSRNQLLRQLNLRFNSTYLSDDKLDELSNAICFVKNMMLSGDEIEDYGKDTDIEHFSQMYKSYEEYKRENNLIDYDDMLTITLDLFNKNAGLLNAYRRKYKYINVDESQDTSFLQHQIIKCLANPVNNIFMVGDEDQSIYTFRAAFPKALMEFKETYPGAQVLLMENNYRSTKGIVSAANLFIKQNKERYNKNMFTEKDDGVPANYNFLKDKDEQYGCIVSLLQKSGDFSGTAVLYRNNISAIPVADALQRNRIPFYIREAKNHFFRHWVTTDIVSFMSLSLDGADIEAFRQIYYKMNAYISKPMVEFAAENIGAGRNVFEVLQKFPEKNEKMALRLAELRRSVGKLAGFSAIRAIEFIVDDIGYGEYLKKSSNEESYSADSLMQMVSSLKSIAAKTGSVPDFMERLAQLQNVMEGARHNKGKNAVTLSTIHSSKGLEFDRVCIIDLFDGQFPSGGSIRDFYADDKTLMEEEVRLFYVGATRAKQQLELFSADMVYGRKARPSRFINQFMAVYKKQEGNAGQSFNAMKWPAGAEGQPAEMVSSAKAVYKVSIDESKYSDKGVLTADNELCIDMPVYHSKFGVGVVRFVNPKFDLLEINFESAGAKTLSLKACINSGLLHKLELTTIPRRKNNSGNAEIHDMNDSK